MTDRDDLPRGLPGDDLPGDDLPDGAVPAGGAGSRVDELRAASAEVDALRALLAPVGLAASVVDASDPADARDEVAVAAALARILAAPAAGPGTADDLPADAAARGDAIGSDDVTSDDPPVEAGVAPVVPLHRPGRSPARRRWWTVAAGAAAVAVVGVGITVLPGGEAPPSAVASGAPPMLAYPVEPAAVAAGEGEEARGTLLDLAAAADAQTDPARGGDVQHLLSQNYWSSTTVDGSGSTTTIDPVVSETWLSPDGSSVNLEWRGAPLHEDGMLERIRTVPEDATVDRLPAGTFDAGAVDALPTEPDALRAALLEPYAGVGCGPDGDPAQSAWCVYYALTGFADFWVLPSDVEAAAWTVLADEPGVSVAGTVVDRAGHEAVAISVPAPSTFPDPVVLMLLVDRETGRLSGREEITLRSEAMDIDEPTVTYFRYQVSAAWVAEVGGPPDDR